MAVRTRIDPLDIDIAAIINQDLSPEEQGKVRARFARETLEDAQEANRRVLGMVPLHDTYVDRVKDAPLESVKPDGSILFEFRLLDDALTWISEQLVQRAPFRTGRYAASFALFADDVEVDIVNPPAAAKEFVFLSTVPYARKIEYGQSPMAPDGVFEGVASLAGKRFDNTAKIGFGWRSVAAGQLEAWARTPGAKAHADRHGRRRDVEHWLRRQPVIVVRPHGQQGSR